MVDLDSSHFDCWNSSLKTRDLAFLTQGFVFVNIGMTLIIIIVLLATTGRENMHPASYVFTQTYNCESRQPIPESPNSRSHSHRLAKQRAGLHVWFAFRPMDHDGL